MVACSCYHSAIKWMSLVEGNPSWTYQGRSDCTLSSIQPQKLLNSFSRLRQTDSDRLLELEKCKSSLRHWWPRSAPRSRWGHTRGRVCLYSRSPDKWCCTNRQRLLFAARTDRWSSGTQLYVASTSDRTFVLQNKIIFRPSKTKLFIVRFSPTYLNTALLL